LIPSCARAVMAWEGAEARLRVANARVLQRAKEGQSLPRSFGVPRARARLQPLDLNISSETTPEPAFLARRGHLEAWKRRSEPPLL
ncbi:MAG TPA: AAA family ATPase, partial [Ktedonobacteraceae bacterium]|nr:AAA family ATPase [Ktedonobacteraceae bacterium]